MTRINIFTFSCFLFFICASVCNSENLPSKNQSKTDIIVKFKKHILKEDIIYKKLTNFEKLNHKYNVKSKKEFFKKTGELKEDKLKEELGLTHIYKLTFKYDVNIEDALNAYNNSPDIEYAEPDYIHELHYLPN